VSYVHFGTSEFSSFLLPNISIYENTLYIIYSLRINKHLLESLLQDKQIKRQEGGKWKKKSKSKSWSPLPIA
jgi:hypothetical protein